MTAPAMSWALLVRAPMEWVRAQALRRWDEQYGGARDEVAAWELREGGAGWVVVGDREPGSEGVDEPWAEELSRELEMPVYLLRFREGANVVWTYQRGRQTRAEDESPHAWASRLGVSFDGV